jgi:protein-tyrosine phosphatase
VKLYQFGPNLYVSRLPRKAEDADAVREAGVDVIYTLCRKRPHDKVLDAVAVWHHCPLPDKRVGEPPVEDLRQIVSSILWNLSSGDTVLVHCVEGRNRSVLAAVLAERAHRGWTGQEAWEHATAVRPRCLNNTAFADWLRSLSRGPISCTRKQQ